MLALDNKHLFSPDESEEFPTEERCHIIELLNNHSEEAMSIARARVEPGITTAWHRLIDMKEIYYILSGDGIMYIDEEKGFNVKQGDVVSIPAGAAQRIHNPDSENDLVFLAICNPAFTDQAYESLE